MILVITSIELKSVFHFFKLSSNALKVSSQLKKTNCRDFKKKGFWKKHYTMTLWDDELQMKSFAKNGAHLEAMKHSSNIANEIRTTTIEIDHFPSWAKAEELLKDGNVIRF